jgi:SRSO17 transposase
MGILSLRGEKKMKKIITEMYNKVFGRLMDSIKGCFAGKQGVENAEKYLKGLTSDAERKNGWQIAESQGEKDPFRIQQFIYRGSWEADEVRDKLQEHVKETMIEEDGTTILDDTGFIKKGKKSAGVQRQYTGTVGKIENCQIGVFLTYVGSKGYTMIDRDLYLPEEWTKDKKRREEAGIPKEAKFRTKPEMGLEMLKRASTNGITYKYVTADCAYGDDGRIRKWLESQDKEYVLAVSGKCYVTIEGHKKRISTVIEESREGFDLISSGEGTKSDRYYKWKKISIDSKGKEGFEESVLIRRSSDQSEETRAFVCHYREGTTIGKLVSVSGTRWRVEQGFEEAKGEVGLDQYEVRSYEGWYKHITLSMCAHTLLTEIQSEIELSKAQKCENRVYPLTMEEAIEGIKKGVSL